METHAQGMQHERAQGLNRPVVSAWMRISGARHSGAVRVACTHADSNATDSQAYFLNETRAGGGMSIVATLTPVHTDHGINVHQWYAASANHGK